MLRLMEAVEVWIDGLVVVEVAGHLVDYFEAQLTQVSESNSL